MINPCSDWLFVLMTSDQNKSKIKQLSKRTALNRCTTASKTEECRGSVSTPSILGFGVFKKVSVATSKTYM